MAQNQPSEGFPEDILRKIHAKQSSKGWTTTFFYLMKELHLSDEQLLEMPLSRISVLTDELIDHQKREEKAMKKGSKK
jgi:hypothetical protein